MTIYQQIKKIMEGKDGRVVTSAFLKNEMKNKFGVNPNSVIPSDFCYNRVNDGIKFHKDNRIFEYIGRNTYKYLGEKYPYTGKIWHKSDRSKRETVVGEWHNGEMQYSS